MLTSQTRLRGANRSTQNAFSLIELVIGLAVISVLFALGIPSFKAWVLNSQIRDGGEAILNGIQLARANAIQQNRLVVFKLTAGSPSTWWVRLDANRDNGPDIQAWSAQEGAANTTITPTPAAATSVTFNGLGQRVSNGDGSATMTQVDVTSSTATTADAIRPLRIVISASGSPKMCDPDPVLVSAGDPRAC